MALAAWVVGGLARVDISTSATSFLPSGDPTVQAVQREASQFGGDPVVVLLSTKQDQVLLTQKDYLTDLLHLEGQFAHLHNVASVYGPATLLNQIAIAGQNFLATLAGRRSGLQRAAEQAAQKAGETPDQVTAAGQSAISAFDDYYAPLLVKALPAGLPTLSNPSFVKTVVYEANGRPRAQWHFVVPAANTVAVLVEPSRILDQGSTTTLVGAIRADIRAARLVGTKVTVTGVPVVVGSLGTEVEHELPLVGGLVALVLVLRFLFVPSRLIRRRRLWPLATTVVGTAATLAGFGWLGRPLSFAAAAVLPLFLGIGSSFPLYLATLANRRRVVVMSLGSAAGFASLAVSPLPVVRELGLALAAGVVLTMGAPLAFGRPPPPDAPPDQRVTTGSMPMRSDGGRVGSPLPRLGRGQSRAMLAGLIALSALGWVALSSFSVQADPESLARGLPALKTAGYAQGVIGYSGEVDVVFSGPTVMGTAGLAWQREAEAALVDRYGTDVRSVLTVPDLLAFLGTSPTAAQITAATNLLPAYLTSAVVLPGNHEAVLVFGAKLAGLAPKVLAGITSALPPPPSGYHARVVGLPVAAARGYRLISSGRYLENLAGIAAAGIVLAVGLRRKADAARAVLASLLAAGWGLAGLWLVGWSLNPLTVTLGSLTAVAGGEFVVLLSEAGHAHQAWLRRSVAAAAATSALGYAAITVSRLTVLRQFGLVLTGTVVLAYLGAVAVVWLLPSDDGVMGDAPTERDQDRMVPQR